MDDFDILLKEKAKQEPVNIPDSLELLIMKTLKDLPLSRKKYPRPAIAAAVVAALIILPIMTVWGKDIPVINSILEYFKGESTQRYSDDTGVYKKYCIDVGKTVTDNGVSLRIDSVGCDDNFLVLFYTVEGDVEKTFKGRDEDVLPRSLFGQIIINGKEKSHSNNDRNDYDAYLTSEGQLKGLMRLDVSRDNLPPELNIDFLVDNVFGKQGQWNFELHVSKEAAMKETRVITVNQEASIQYLNQQHNIKIEKVCFSPFGNQILISEKYAPGPKGDNWAPFSNFALFDDQGNAVDVLPAQVMDGIEGAENSFEFIKCNKNTRSLTLVPICPTSTKPEIPYNPAGVSMEKLPLELKVSSKGSIIIEKVDFSDMDTRVYYTKKGVVTPIGNGYFNLLDENGHNIESHITCSSVVDREKGLYVEIFPKLDRSKKYKIKFFTDSGYNLLYQYKIEIPLILQ